MKLKRITNEGFKTLARAGKNLDGALLAKSIVSEVTKSDEDDRVLTFSLSTEDVDREGDIVKLNGWDLKEWRKNPLILWNHERPSIIGKGTKAWIDKAAGKLMVSAQFMTREESELADTLYKWVLGGYLKTTSPGFRAVDWDFRTDGEGILFKKQKLYEGSLVPIPANPNVGYEARAKGLDAAPIKAWVIKALDGDIPANRFSPRPILEAFYKSLDDSESVTVPEEVEYVDWSDEGEETMKLSEAVERLVDVSEKLADRMEGVEKSLEEIKSLGVSKGVPNSEGSEDAGSEDAAAPIKPAEPEETSPKSSDEPLITKEDIREMFMEVVSEGAKQIRDQTEKFERQKSGYAD